MNQIKTVGELKAALAKFDDNLPLASVGPDEGGFDAENKDGVNVYPLTLEDGRKAVFVGGGRQPAGRMKEAAYKEGRALYNRHMLRKYNRLVGMQALERARNPGYSPSFRTIRFMKFVELVDESERFDRLSRDIKRKWQRRAKDRLKKGLQ